VEFYTLIWLSALWFAGVSLALMFLLVLRRFYTDRRQRRYEAHQDELLTRLLDHLAEGEPAGDAELAANAKDVQVLNDIIEHLLRSVSGEERDRLVAVLCSLGGVEKKLKSLRRGKEWERTAAATALRRFDRPEVVAALRAALDDPSPDVRGAAARALHDLGAIDSAKTLVDKLVIEASLPPHALRDIFRKLGRRYCDDMLDVLRSDVETARIVAIDSLAHSGELRVVDPLLRLISEGSKEITANAFRALAILGDPRALPAVMSGLRDPAWEVRCQAALCAGRIGAVEAKGLLARLLEDPIWWVRYRSAEALHELGEQGIWILRGLTVQSTRAGETAHLVLAEKAA
jgi:HEAT repeat protein